MHTDIYHISEDVLSSPYGQVKISQSIQSVDNEDEERHFAGQSESYHMHYSLCLGTTEVTNEVTCQNRLYYSVAESNRRHIWLYMAYDLHGDINCSSFMPIYSHCNT